MGIRTPESLGTSPGDAAPSPTVAAWSNSPAAATTARAARRTARTGPSTPPRAMGGAGASERIPIGSNRMRSGFSGFAHALIGKPVPTFPEHALPAETRHQRPDALAAPAFDGQRLAPERD